MLIIFDPDFGDPFILAISSFFDFGADIIHRIANPDYPASSHFSILLPVSISWWNWRFDEMFLTLSSSDCDISVIQFQGILKIIQNLDFNSYLNVKDRSLIVSAVIKDSTSFCNNYHSTSDEDHVPRWVSKFPLWGKYE